MMKTLVRPLLIGLTLVVLLSTGIAYAGIPRPQVQEPGLIVSQVPVSVALPQDDDVVPINGLAYWATEPTGPDFSGVTLIPFQAHNPTLEIWEQTLSDNERYSFPYITPQNTQVSHSGWITGASHFVNDFSEVMVYLDPTDPNHLLGCSKFFWNPPTYDFYTGVFESYDGGYTWSEMQPPGVEQYSMTSDPVTTFDHLGNAYFTLLTRGPTGLDMLKKPAGGDWEWPVVVDRTTYTDKQWIMGDQDPQSISPYAGYLYMSWTDVGASRIVFSRSTDGNQSWSSPLQLASSGVQGSIPGTAPDGTVYVVFGRDIFYGPSPGTMEFVKSTDGGASFTSAAVAANITAIPWYLPDPFGNPTNFRSPASLPAFAVSPANGNLYIAWADYRNGDADIYFTRSTDEGVTWSDPVRLNDDPVSNGIDQFQPQVSVAPNGRVAVMWFDRRLPCPELPWIPQAHWGVYNGCIDTYMTRSFDEGVTWVPNIRASAQSWDWTLNLPITSGGDGFIGDYQGIASNNEIDFPFWNATANLGENAENYQEVFVAHVPVSGSPDLSPSAKEVTPDLVLAGEVLTYTVLLYNRGFTDAVGAYMTDTMPLSTTFVYGSLWASSGEAGYDPGAQMVTWTGVVSMNLGVTVTFAVTTDVGLAEGEQIVNQAWITDGAGIGFWRAATATVSVPPFIVATDPADGMTSVPVTATVVVTFSEEMEPSSLLVGAEPDPGGWNAQWSYTNTVLALTHDPFAYDTSYTLTVQAQDMLGDDLVAGPVPNPWSFDTEQAPPDFPYIVVTEPADGEMDVPLTATVVVTFSEAISTTTFSLTAEPDPGGWSATWLYSDTVVLLDHTAFASETTYTLTVWAEDVEGESLVAGPVPNPWSFATAGTVTYQIYLPLISK
jgi:uncharacterized repeat protein (TIGR01451 family)